MSLRIADKADRIEAAWDEDRRRDARELVEHLLGDGTGPSLTDLAAEAPTWDDFEWQVLEGETGCQYGAATRNHVLRLLAAMAAR